jgi:hypothetical protein
VHTRCGDRGDVEFGRHRLLGLPADCPAEGLVGLLPAGNAHGGLGSVRQVPLDCGAAVRFQHTVYLGVEVVFADWPFAAHYFTLRSIGRSCPWTNWDSRSRALLSRDITVPIGMPSIEATSS